MPLEPLYLRVAPPRSLASPRTIRLSRLPLITIILAGCNDEVAIYHEAVVHTLDAERSERWGREPDRAGVLVDVVERVARPYSPRPTILRRRGGEVVGVIASPALVTAGVRVEDAAGRELVMARRG